MPRDITHRQIKVGDYVRRVEAVEQFNATLECRRDLYTYSRTGIHYVSYAEDGDWIGIDGEQESGWYGRSFEVVSSGPLDTVCAMSYHILRQLEKA